MMRLRTRPTWKLAPVIQAVPSWRKTRILPESASATGSPTSSEASTTDLEVGL